jgi:hypothetical protein
VVHSGPGGSTSSSSGMARSESVIAQQQNARIPVDDGAQLLSTLVNELEAKASGNDGDGRDGKSRSPNNPNNNSSNSSSPGALQSNSGSTLLAFEKVRPAFIRSWIGRIGQLDRQQQLQRVQKENDLVERIYAAENRNRAELREEIRNLIGQLHELDAALESV